MHVGGLITAVWIAHAEMSPTNVGELIPLDLHATSHLDNAFRLRGPSATRRRGSESRIQGRIGKPHSLACRRTVHAQSRRKCGVRNLSEEKALLASNGARHGKAGRKPRVSRDRVPKRPGHDLRDRDLARKRPDHGPSLAAPVEEVEAAEKGLAHAVIETTER
jgi:hypothetical protein